MALSLHTKLCDMLEIEYPVMAFTHIRDVAAAVCNGGGSAVLGAIGFTPEEIAVEVRWLKAHTDKPFGIDLVFPKASPEIATREQLLSLVPREYRDFVDRIKEELGLPKETSRWDGLALGLGGTHEFQMKQLDAAIKAKPAIIAAGLGITRRAVDECHATGIKVISLVGNVKNARRAAALGVDIIVAQGTEAGGHTGRIGTMALVPQVVDAVSPIPVLAAGGIGDGRGLVAALALGAIGAWTGTIWLTSHEYPLADWIKDKMLEATDEDAVITKAYTGKTCRFLNNKYIEAWKRPDAPQTLPMPLQNLYSPMPEEVLTVDPKSVSLFGQPHLRDWTSTPAGNVMGLIKQRKSARQILYDMVSEAINILGTE
jgi:NAD(P)H-dependent flavin oxidoreductase YrpB (nitropropane dioxygenase family)